MAFDWALPYPANRQPVFARNMVATSQPLATAAGLAALKSGGNAVDAALAAADRDDVRDLREAGRRLARLRGRGQQRALDRRQRNAKRIDERSLARGRERDDCGRLGRACAQREES